MKGNLRKTFYQFLIKSQKYTKADNIYLFKHGSWLVLGQVCGSLLSFGLALAFANFLSKETYGAYKYVISLAGLLSVFTLRGIDTSVVWAVSRQHEGSFSKALKIKLSWGLWGSLAGLGLSLYYYFQSNNNLALCFVLSAPFIFLMDSFELYSAFLAGRKLFKTQVKYSLILRFILTLCLTAAAFLSGKLVLLVLIYFGLNTLLRIYFYWHVKAKLKPNKKEDVQTVPYGKHLTLMTIPEILANQIDKILVFHYLGAAQLAVYSMALVIPEQLKGFLKNIGSMALPKLSQRSKEEIQGTIRQKVIRLGLFILLGLIVYIILAPPFFRLFFPQYLESVLYSQVFSLSLVASAAILPITALKAQVAKKQLYYLNFIVPLLQIVFLFIAGPYGIWGIVLAKILGRYLRAFFSYYLVQKI